MLAHDDIVFMHETVDRGATPHSPYQVPAHATDVSGLPPAIIVTAECDPIRDWENGTPAACAMPGCRPP